MYLLAIDPGPHTGLALFDGNDLVKAWTVTLELPCTSQDMAVFYKQLDHVISDFWLSSARPVLVIESFHTVSQTIAASLAGRMTNEIRGFIIGTALVAGINVQQRTPASRHPFIQAAVSYPHDTKHAVDAIAHGLHYLHELTIR